MSPTPFRLLRATGSGFRTWRASRLSSIERLESRRLLDASGVEGPPDVTLVDHAALRSLTQSGDGFGVSPADPRSADELLIRLDPEISPAALRRLYDEYGLTENQDTRADEPVAPWKHVTPATSDSDDLLAVLRADPRVVSADRNHVRSVALTPADSLFDQLWALNNEGQSGGTPDADTDTTEAWSLTTGSRQVIVGVIDTGVDYNHPDLLQNLWSNPGEIPADGIDNDGNGYVDDVHGINAITGSGDPMDDHGHGTHVAGTIGAGAFDDGVVGVNWNVSIVACKFLSAIGTGTDADAIECFRYFNHLKNVLGHEVLVTNNSWGGGGFSQTLADAMAGTDQPGMQPILHVAAAGNDNQDNDLTPFYPASYTLDNVLAVAATDHDDLYAGFSNHGSDSVDIAAPGVGILSTVPTGNCTLCDTDGYRPASGTSMATPHVAGAAALVWSAFPGATADQVKSRLIGGTDDISGLAGNQTKSTRTGGRLNIHQALVGAVPLDTAAPAPVDDLNASDADLGSALLTWTATGDDGQAGTASYYDIRYSTSPITSGNWQEAERATGTNVPLPSGAAESFVVSGLDFGTHYFFAVRVLDEAGNGALSNVTEASTTNGSIVLADDMEQGPQSWTIEGEPGLWHLSTHRSHGGETAWYYGIDDVWNYDYSSTASNWGKLTSPSISLPVSEQLLLRFSEWSQLEANPAYDRTRVRISTDGENWPTVFESHGTGGVWAARAVDLTSYAGHEIQIEFWMDTRDNLQNGFEGWYVDDVAIVAATDQPLPAVPALTIDDATVVEGNEGTTDAIFTIRLSAASSQSITVDYETGDGTARDGSDYEGTSGSAVFAPGETTATVTIAVLGDVLDEPDEAFVLNLTGVSGGVITDGQAIATVLDDDAAPSLTIDDVTLWEGDSETVDAVFTVSLSAPSGQVIEVGFDTADGTATAAEGDFMSASGTLTFLPGQTSRSIAVTIQGDTIVEEDETFLVELGDVSGAVLARHQGIGTILNDEQSQVIEVTIDDVAVEEGKSRTTEAVFTVTLSEPSSSPVTVQYSTADGSAESGTDYAAATGTLTIAAGETTGTIVVGIEGDRDEESDETFFVNLDMPTGAVIVDAVGFGTIINDDQPPGSKGKGSGPSSVESSNAPQDGADAAIEEEAQAIATTPEAIASLDAAFDEHAAADVFVGSEEEPDAMSTDAGELEIEFP